MAIDIQELNRLSRQEKLRIINSLWENMTDPELPESEWDEIFRRQANADLHPEELLTVDQMWSQVSRRPSK